MLPESARHLFETNACAHVVTLGARGNPHVTLAWVGLDGDDITMATLHDQRKLRDLRRDPRIVLSLEGKKLNEYGLLEYIVVHGTAEITEGGAPEMLQQFAYRYLGPDVEFPPMPNPPPGFITRIHVERVGGMGEWAR